MLISNLTSHSFFCLPVLRGKFKVLFVSALAPLNDFWVSPLELEVSGMVVTDSGTLCEKEEAEVLDVSLTVSIWHRDLSDLEERWLESLAVSGTVVTDSLLKNLDRRLGDLKLASLTVSDARHGASTVEWLRSVVWRRPLDADDEWLVSEWVSEMVVTDAAAPPSRLPLMDPEDLELFALELQVSGTW